MIVMSFYNRFFFWVFFILDIFLFIGKFLMMRGFCGCMNIFESIDLFIYKIILDICEVFFMLRK